MESQPPYRWRIIIRVILKRSLGGEKDLRPFKRPVGTEITINKKEEGRYRADSS
jgi:hypothetical protein